MNELLEILFVFGMTFLYAAVISLCIVIIECFIEAFTKNDINKDIENKNTTSKT